MLLCLPFASSTPESEFQLKRNRLHPIAGMYYPWRASETRIGALPSLLGLVGAAEDDAHIYKGVKVVCFNAASRTIPQRTGSQMVTL